MTVSQVAYLPLYLKHFVKEKADGAEVFLAPPTHMKDMPQNKLDPDFMCCRRGCELFIHTPTPI